LRLVVAGLGWAAGGEEIGAGNKNVSGLSIFRVSGDPVAREWWAELWLLAAHSTGKAKEHG
jgi:hypothetical protein